jgi:nucleotide-binding universal stress UspA family protein
MPGGAFFAQAETRARDSNDQSLAQPSQCSPGMKPKILVPFDFSETAERALSWAADLQHTTGAPAIAIVHAISSRPPGTQELPLEMLLPTADETAELDRTMIEAALRREAIAIASVRIGASPVGDIILDAAKSIGAELIVMGSHGRTGIKRLVLGSVAEHVLRHAQCPVVTVRAGQGK